MNSDILTFAGAAVLAAGCYAVMRLRRHSAVEALCFAGGVLGMMVILFVIKTVALQ